METKGRKDVFTVTEKDGHSFWTKLGIGLPNRDGSMNLYLDALPVNGRLQIRDPKPREEQRGEGRTPYAGPFEPAASVQ